MGENRAEASFGNDRPVDFVVKVKGEALRVVWPFIIRSNLRRQVNSCELAQKKVTMLLRATIQAVFGNRTPVLRLRKPLAIVLSSP